ARMRVAAQPLLHLQRQPVHAFAHVGPTHCQPHSNPARNRDHPRASAATTAAAKAGDTEAGIRIRALPANSISIAGTGGTATPSPGRRHQHLSEAIRRGPKIPSPTIDQTRRHVGLSRHVPHHCTRPECRRYDRLLLLDAPPATTLWTSQYLDASHRSTSCTGANTGPCPTAQPRHN